MAKEIDFESLIPFLQYLIETILSGALAVVGGAIPLTVILYLIFLRARNIHRSQVENELKLIEINKETIAHNKPKFDLIVQKLIDGDLENSPELTELLGILKSAYSNAEQEIISSEAYVRKVESATFINWVSYHFTKSYFSHYFSKN